MHARTCTWIMINCTFSGTSRNSLDAELSVCFSVLFCFDFFFLFNELNRFLIVVTGVTQPANYQHYCPLNFLTCTNWLRLKKGEINCAGRDLRRSGTKCEIWAFWHTSDLDGAMPAQHWHPPHTPLALNISHPETTSESSVRAQFPIWGFPLSALISIRAETNLTATRAWALEKGSLVFELRYLAQQS